MQHFDLRNLDRIRDAAPKTWATVHFLDTATFAELARCGFHLIDMRGEIWTVRRAG